MMNFDKHTGTLTMERHNLEHCGFDWEYFDGELFLNGIEDAEAREPRTIVIRLDAKRSTWE